MPNRDLIRFDVFLNKEQTLRSETGRLAIGLGIALAIGLRRWPWPCPFHLPLPLAVPFSLGLAPALCYIAMPRRR